VNKLKIETKKDASLATKYFTALTEKDNDFGKDEESEIKIDF